MAFLVKSLLFSYILTATLLAVLAFLLYKLGLDEKDLWILFLSCCALLTVSLLQESGVKIRETLAKQNLYFRWAVYLGAVFSLVLFGVYGLN